MWATLIHEQIGGGFILDHKICRSPAHRISCFRSKYHKYTAFLLHSSGRRGRKGVPRRDPTHGTSRRLVPCPANHGPRETPAVSRARGPRRQHRPPRGARSPAVDGTPPVVLLLLLLRPSAEGLLLCLQVPQLRLEIPLPLPQGLLGGGRSGHDREGSPFPLRPSREGDGPPGVPTAPRTDRRAYQPLRGPEARDEASSTYHRLGVRQRAHSCQQPEGGGDPGAVGSTFLGSAVVGLDGVSAGGVGGDGPRIDRAVAAAAAAVAYEANRGGEIRKELDRTSCGTRRLGAGPLPDLV